MQFQRHEPTVRIANVPVYILVTAFYQDYVDRFLVPVTENFSCADVLAEWLNDTDWDEEGPNNGGGKFSADNLGEWEVGSFHSFDTTDESWSIFHANPYRGDGVTFVWQEDV